jgi:single-strand DNA-binding protein
MGNPLLRKGPLDRWRELWKGCETYRTGLSCGESDEKGMLQLSFAGTLGRDPETRHAGRSEVTEFSVAVNGYDFSKKEKTTTWLKVNIWGDRGAKLGELVSKGDKVAGSGVLSFEEYETRDGDKRITYKVTCQELTLQGGRKRDDDEPRRSKGKARPAQESFPDAVDDDDIPF